MRVALSIAGSDPTGGAGIQADVQVFRSFGVHGSGVVTALTVQDTQRVHRVLPTFPNVVLDQLRVLLRDLRPDALKLGMLASDDVARNVELGLRVLEDDGARPPLVVDPVLAASDGTPLLERRAWDTLRSLCAGAALVTPNLAEAEALSGCDTSTREGVEAAACTLLSQLGARGALVKGGHADGPPDDLLARREGGGVSLDWLPGERVADVDAHGSGCALAAAVTAGLARGDALVDAVHAARAFVAEALQRIARGEGRGRLLPPAPTT